MKWKVEMGSVAMVFVTYSIKIGSGSQKLRKGISRYTGSMQIA
jgi:hypothetical protein